MSKADWLQALAPPQGEAPDWVSDTDVSLPVDGCGKRIQVSWVPAMPVTALGELVYFAE